MNQFISHKFLVKAYGNFHTSSTVKLLDITSFLPGISNIKLNYQVIVMLFIACLIASLLVYMLFYMFFKNMYEKKYDKWRLISDLLIRKAVFYDDDDDETEEETIIPVTTRAKKLMRSRHYRKLLTEEIMS